MAPQPSAFSPLSSPFSFSITTATTPIMTSPVEASESKTTQSGVWGKITGALRKTFVRPATEEGRYGKSDVNLEPKHPRFK